MAQQVKAKRSTRTTTKFFWRITDGGEMFLQELANLREDGAERFRQRYAPSFDRLSRSELFRLRDELRALWTGGKEMPPSLARVWDEREAAGHGTTLDEFICNRWLHNSRGGLVIIFGEIQPDLNSPLALLAYCAHLYSRRMKICANSDCQASYFVARRADQLYCSTDCAAPAKRESKRRSARQHRDKWPSQRHNSKRSQSDDLATPH